MLAAAVAAAVLLAVAVAPAAEAVGVALLAVGVAAIAHWRDEAVPAAAAQAACVPLSLLRLLEWPTALPMPHRRRPSPRRRCQCHEPAGLAGSVGSAIAQWRDHPPTPTAAQAAQVQVGRARAAVLAAVSAAGRALPTAVPVAVKCHPMAAMAPVTLVTPAMLWWPAAPASVAVGAALATAMAQRHWQLPGPWQSRCS